MTRVHAAMLPRELERMKNQGKEGGKMETGSKNMENEMMVSESNGISMEGELDLKSCWEFLREEARDGTFNDNYMLNLKEQMRMRRMRETKSEGNCGYC